MNFSISLLAQACTLAIGVSLLQGCNSGGEFAATGNTGQSSSNTEFVHIANNSNTPQGGNGGGDDGDVGGSGGGDGGGDGNGGDNGGGDGGGDGNGNGNGNGDGGGGGGGGGDGNGGDNGDGNGGDNGGGNGGGDGGGDGNGGDSGDGDGDGGDSGDGDSGMSNRNLAISALEYAASHANLARFAQSLEQSGLAAGNYQCANSGSASMSESATGASTWIFTSCALPSDSGTSVSYDGQLSIVCAAENRTSGENARNCTNTYTELCFKVGDRSGQVDGVLATESESASLQSNSSAMTTESTLDTWRSSTHSIASEGSELRGLNVQASSAEAGYSINIIGQAGYAQASTGCLISGAVLLKDVFSDAGFSVSAQGGDNMLLSTGDSHETIGCAEVQPAPYTAIDFN